MVLAVLAAFLPYPASAAAQPDTTPAWFANTESVYPDSEYIWVLGDSVTQENAKNQALIEMSQYFHTTVETVTKDIAEYQEIISATENKISEKLYFNQFSRIESNEDFFGISFTDAWFNPKRKEYTILAYINRKDAEAQYHSRIETNMVGIYALMSTVARNEDPIYSGKLLSEGKSAADVTKKYIENMSLVNPGKSKEYLQRYTPYLNTIQQLYSEYDRLRNTRINVTVEFRGNTPISETDKATMRQSVQDAIGLYNVPVQMRIDPVSAAAAGQSGYAFVFTLNSGPTPSGLLEANVALTFTHNGETLPLPSISKGFKEQDTTWVIKRAVTYIQDNRDFFQAVTAEINQ
jgi:hypothetical protein